MCGDAQAYNILKVKSNETDFEQQLHHQKLEHTCEPPKERENKRAECGTIM